MKVNQYFQGCVFMSAEQPILSDWIVRVRKSNNLNQAEFGRLINRGQGTVSRYESGVERIPRSVFLKICRVFEESYDLPKNDDPDIFRIARCISEGGDLCPVFWDIMITACDTGFFSDRDRVQILSDFMRLLMRSGA